MQVLGAVLAFVFGLIAGSFTNAWAWRLKVEKSILTGRSMCPQCKHTLYSRDLVPIVSWMLVRGRCRYCEANISWQYPAVELVSGLLFVLSFFAWDYSASYSGALLVIWLAFLTPALTIAVFDLRWMLIPLYPLVVMAVLAIVYRIVQFFSGESVALWLGSPLLGVLIFGGIFYLLYMYPYKKLMGFGDVQLISVLAIMLGLTNTFIAVFAASLFGTLVMLPALITRKISRASLIPFGPLLIAGSVFAMFFGNDLVESYSNFLIY